MMILRSPDPALDVASAIDQGGRDYQEDAIITDFSLGTGIGFAVLADGMGGHAAGDIASKIVITEVFSELKFIEGNLEEDEASIPMRLRAAADSANGYLQSHVTSSPETRGMGATLVSLVLVQNRLFWLSIGDSPLYLFRRKKLQQLNEDHSMVPQIEFMVESGLLDAETAKDHPDRNCLTSVIMGAPIPKTDCPDKPFVLEEGDIILLSSDGLQYLEDAKIQKILHKNRRKSSFDITATLLKAIKDLADPDQDNVSFTVIKMNHIPPATSKPALKAEATRESGVPETRSIATRDEEMVEPAVAVEK